MSAAWFIFKNHSTDGRRANSSIKFKRKYQVQVSIL